MEKIIVVYRANEGMQSTVYSRLGNYNSGCLLLHMSSDLNQSSYLYYTITSRHLRCYIIHWIYSLGVSNIRSMIFVISDRLEP